jgi:hypothetical protein
MDSAEWKCCVVELVRVKQLLDDLDRRHLWEYHLPGVAATEAHLGRVDDHLGEPLDDQYRQFLKHANGWRAVVNDVDLFGVDDLLGGPRADRAASQLSYLEPIALDDAGVRREELLPIAVSATAIDLFVIRRPGSAMPGEVIWFAGYEVERYACFDDYFLAMLEYNRREVQKVREALPT